MSKSDVLPLQPISRLWCDECLDWTQWIADSGDTPLVCRSCGTTTCADCGESPPEDENPVCGDCLVIRSALRQENDEWRGSRIWSDEQQPGDDRLNPHMDMRLAIIREDGTARIPDSTRNERAAIRILETGWDPDFGWLRPPQSPLAAGLCPYCHERTCECHLLSRDFTIVWLWWHHNADTPWWRQYRQQRAAFHS